jgi:WD40 repeat protein
MTSDQYGSTPNFIRAGIIAILSSTRKAVGAGFFVSERVALTCAHVVRSAKSAQGLPIWVELHDGTIIQAKVSSEFWAESKEEDVAVLEFEEELPSSVKPLRVGSSENVENQRFITYGFPNNISGGIWGRGEIGYDVSWKGLPLKQVFSQQITTGFSGSPIFIEKAQCVVGMASERTKADLEEICKQLYPTGRLQEVAFATPSSTLKRIFPSLSFDPICPYLGLAAFTSESANFFYGRDKLAAILVNRIQAYPSFLSVTGASGSGKSSIVQAKLLPTIKCGKVAGFDVNTPIVSFRPSQSVTPETAFFLFFRKTAGFTQNNKIDWGDVENYIQNLNKRIVVFIDQFEELFSDQICLEDADEFLDRLRHLLNRSPNLTLILTMRTEFDPRLELSPLKEYVTQGSIVIRGIPGDHLNLKETILQPAESVGLGVESSLLTAITQDLNDTESPLPLLEFTLTELWKKDRLSNRISYSTYESIGKVTGALLRWANEFYQYEISTNSREPRTTEQKTLLKRILGRLVQFGANDVPDVRCRASLQELIDLGREAAKLLNGMADARLIVKDENTAELVHDSLIKEWLKQGELGYWFEEQRQFFLWRQRFGQDVQEWNQDEKKLLHQPYLNTATRWLETHKDELTQNEREYIQKSQKQEKRRQQRFISLLITGLISLSLTSVVALFQWNRAIDREKTAQSIQQATVAEASLDTDTTKSLALALESMKIKETPEAQLAVGKAFYSNHERVYFKHPSPVIYGEYALDDSNKLLTVSLDGKVRIWKTQDSKQPLCTLGEQNPSINHARFNPQNSRQVLTVSNNSTASLWNVDTCQVTQTFKGHSAPIHYGAFNPKNPDQIVTASSDGTAKVWNIKSPEKPIYDLKGHEREVWKAEFHPIDVNRVLTVSADGTAKIWELNAKGKPVSLKTNKGQISDANFDPKKSNKIITVSNDKTAQIWDLNNIDKPITLGTHDSPVVLGIINPENSNQAVTVTQSGSVRLWNIDQPNRSDILLSSVTKASYVAFNPLNKDHLLIVGSGNAVGKAEIWSISKLSMVHELIGHKSDIVYGAFSPSEKNSILTVGKDETARIWDVQPKSIFRTERSESGIIVAARFVSKRKDSVVSINKDGLVKYWDTSSGTTLNSFKINIPLDSLVSADFNPNNYKELVTVNTQGQITLWNLSSKDSKNTNIPLANDKALSISYSHKNPDQVMAITENGVATIHSISNPYKEPVVVTKLPASVIFAQFNPHDESKIITSSQDGKLSIWNIKDTVSLEAEKEFDNDVFWAAGHDELNPNIVFAGGANGRVWIWDLSQNASPLELVGHKGIVTFGSMNSKKRNTIVTSAKDGFVNIWNLDYANEPLSIKEPGEEIVFTTFNPGNFDQILTLTNTGILSLYNFAGQHLLQQASGSLSRCLNPNTVGKGRSSPATDALKRNSANKDC